MTWVGYGMSMAAVVLLSRVVHTLSDGAWALVGVSLWTSQRAKGVREPQVGSLRAASR